MSKTGRSLPNPTVAAAPSDAAPAVAEGVQADPGGQPGSRPGPKAAPRTDVSVPVGQVHVGDTNAMKWQAKKTALREAALVQAAELAKTQDKHPAVFGTRLEEDDGAGEGDAGAAADDKPPEAAKPKPTSSDVELAAIAAKDRENRQLRRKLKDLESAPKTVDRVAKLKELAKTNPRGVSEYLGIPFEQLAAAFLSGAAVEALKLDEDAPPKPAGPREPTEAERERDEARAEANMLRAREGERLLTTAVDKLVKDTKDDGGALRWGNVARLGDDERDGKTAAIRNAQAFGAGLIGEDGKRLPQQRKMKRFDDATAKSVVEHFLDIEDKRLSLLARKMGAGSQKPQPRVTVNGSRRGAPVAFDPSNPRDPNNPRNRPSYIELGEAHRAKHFGPR